MISDFTLSFQEVYSYSISKRLTKDLMRDSFYPWKDIIFDKEQYNFREVIFNFDKRFSVVSWIYFYRDLLKFIIGYDFKEHFLS